MATKGSVVLVGDYDYSYPREKQIRRGLELNDIDVLEARFAEEERIIGPVKLLLLPLFYIRVARQIRSHGKRETGIDGIVLTKFNVSMLPIVWWYARKHDCPLVYDLFVSLYRTAEMRGVNRLIVWGLRTLERLLLPLATHYTVGTNQFIDLYSDLYDLPAEKFVRLPPGADEEWYHPIEDATEREPFTVLYWGNFLPHHGLQPIVDAAEELSERAPEIEIVFVGDGPLTDEIEREVADRGLGNVRFEGFVPMEDLQEWIATSQISLGVFSDDVRALSSITNKVSEGVAMRRPVLTERSPAIEEYFEHRESIYLVPPEDGEAIVKGILELREDPELREHIAREGHETYQAEFSPQRIGEILTRTFDLGDAQFDDE